MQKRLVVGLLAGMLLGVLCIIGASLRYSEAASTSYLFSFWYNRVVMGLLIGLTPKINMRLSLVRGAILGGFVSFAFYSSTNFQDLTGFLAGIVYGIIIAFAIEYFDNVKIKAN